VGVILIVFPIQNMIHIRNSASVQEVVLRCAAAMMYETVYQ